MEKYYIKSAKYSITERATKTKGKVYDLFFRFFTIDGKEQQKRVRGFKTKQLAKEWYSQFITENCELKRNLPKYEKGKAYPTFEELAEEYFSTLRTQNKESSIITKQNYYRKHIQPFFEDKRIDTITKEDTFEFQNYLWSEKKDNGEDYGYYSHTLARSVAFSILSYGASKYGTRNYLSEIKLPKRIQSKKRMQIWTQEQFKQFLSVCEDGVYKVFFAFLFYTGKRFGEATAINISDVDLKKKEVLINKTLTRHTASKEYKIQTTKNNKENNIPICPALLPILSEYISTLDKKQKCLFLNKKGKVIDNMTAKLYLIKKAEQANLPIIRIHDLRHSFASMLIHNGANMMVVAELLADNVEQILHTYGHLYQEDLHKVVDCIK